MTFLYITTMPTDPHTLVCETKHKKSRTNGSIKQEDYKHFQTIISYSNFKQLTLTEY